MGLSCQMWALKLNSYICIRKLLEQFDFFHVDVNLFLYEEI